MTPSSAMAGRLAPDGGRYWYDRDLQLWVVLAPNGCLYDLERLVEGRARAGRKAQILGGEVYPNGPEWRCSECGYICGDYGPNRCPNDGTPLTRTMMTIPLGAR